VEVETEKGWERSGGRMGEREEGQETEITAMIYSIALPYQNKCEDLHASYPSPYITPFIAHPLYHTHNYIVYFCMVTYWY